MVSDQPDEIEVNGFEWNFDPGGNVEYLASHDVTVADVRFVHEHQPLFVRNVPSLSRTATHVVVGRDSRNRSLAIHRKNGAAGNLVSGDRQARSGRPPATGKARTNTMSDYQALAQEIDKLSEAELRLDEGELVAARRSGSKREDVMSIRVTPAELEEITKAAVERGLRVSDFVRQSVLAAARDKSPEASYRRITPPVAAALDRLVESVEQERKATSRSASGRRR